MTDENVIKEVLANEYLQAKHIETKTYPENYSPMEEHQMKTYYIYELGSNFVEVTFSADEIDAERIYDMWVSANSQDVTYALEEVS